MSAEKPELNGPIGLTSKQKDAVIKEILKKWQGPNGITISWEGLQQLMKKLGPYTTVQDAINILKGEQSNPSKQKK